jgi:putative transposase
MANLGPESVYRRNLPHVVPPGATLFVTFRLAGSLPAAVVDALCAEAERLQAVLERVGESSERAARIYREQRRLFGRWDTMLTSGQGPLWLGKPEIAEIVVHSMHRFDGQRYDLLAFTIMPNHVHIVLTPLPDQEGACYPLARIMHTMKGYTAGQANRVLGRTGTFWHHESYDHLVRGPDEIERISIYVLNNPVKAGLVADWQAWPWTYCKHIR